MTMKVSRFAELTKAAKTTKLDQAASPAPAGSAASPAGVQGDTGTLSQVSQSLLANTAGVGGPNVGEMDPDQLGGGPPSGAMGFDPSWRQG